jgi:hypothetical protein
VFLPVSQRSGLQLRLRCPFLALCRPRVKHLVQSGKCVGEAPVTHLRHAPLSEFRGTTILERRGLRKDDGTGFIPPSTRFGNEEPSGLKDEHVEARDVGAWLSLVERPVRDRKVAGSNPVAPTTFTKLERRRRFAKPTRTRSAPRELARHPETLAAGTRWRRRSLSASAEDTLLRRFRATLGWTRPCAHGEAAVVVLDWPLTRWPFASSQDRRSRTDSSWSRWHDPATKRKGTGSTPSCIDRSERKGDRQTTRSCADCR